jgi:cytochrome c peroxidase
MPGEIGRVAMSRRARLALFIAGSGALLAVSVATAVGGSGLTPMEQLGKSLFFDERLSLNQNQSCASCHDPAWGGTGPIASLNAHGTVYQGSVPGRFGDRKPPSSTYATLSPIFHQEKDGNWVGGNFWDGRATGEKLGNPAADQAQGPFLNPKEQALTDSACVVYRACTATAYPTSFDTVWGAGSCDIAWPADAEDTCSTEGVTLALSPTDRAKADQAYDRIALSIAAYEGSDEVNAFTAKYDLTFGSRARDLGLDKPKLTSEEQRGYALFRGKGGCAACHPAGKEALFTDFTFDNLGVPSNPENPAVLENPGFVDPGLGGFLRNAGYEESTWAAELGKQKVPTLRNVDLRPSPTDVKAYSHNGYFKSLEGIVHFYNTRDVLDTCPGPYTEAAALAANCWPAPEVAETVNRDELGDLGLTPDEEAAIVAFLRTLSDGYQP